MFKVYLTGNYTYVYFLIVSSLPIFLKRQRKIPYQGNGNNIFISIKNDCQ